SLQSNWLSHRSRVLHCLRRVDLPAATDLQTALHVARPRSRPAGCARVLFVEAPPLPRHCRLEFASRFLISFPQVTCEAWENKSEQDIFGCPHPATPLSPCPPVFTPPCPANDSALH